MRGTKSRSVGVGLLAIGLVSVKKKSLLALAPDLCGPRPSGLLPAHAHEKATQDGLLARNVSPCGAAQR